MFPAPAWQEVLSGLDILAVNLVVGAIATLLWLLPPMDTPAAWCVGIRFRLRRLLLASLGLLSLTSVALLVARSLVISGQSLPGLGGVLPLVLMRTDFGHAWIVRAGVILVLWIACITLNTGRPQPRLYWLALACVGVVAWTRSATGHPGDHGNFEFAVWIDWLHLMATGLWGGVVIAFIAALHPILRQHAGTGSKDIFRRFSRIAAIGLGIAVATGFYNAWTALGGWRPLWTTRYGAILDVKLGLVLLMALLGASNRYRHVPGLLKVTVRNPDSPAGRTAAYRALAMTCRAEALLVLAILAVVALLVNAMQPTDMP